MMLPNTIEELDRFIRDTFKCHTKLDKTSLGYDCVIITDTPKDYELKASIGHVSYDGINFVSISGQHYGDGYEGFGFPCASYEEIKRAIEHGIKKSNTEIKPQMVQISLFDL